MSTSRIVMFLTLALALAFVSISTSVEASRITKRPFAEQPGEGVDIDYSAELKKNKDGTISVDVTFTNNGKEDVVILFCFMIETTKGEATRTTKEWVLVKEGDTLKCKEDNEENFPGTTHTRDTDHHTSHLGCRVVTIEAGKTAKESFKTPTAFDAGEGIKFSERDFELAYADVTLLKKGDKEFIKYDEESCKDVPGDEHYLKILGGETDRFVTEWAIIDQPVNHPYVTLADGSKIYVTFADWPCMYPEFPLQFTPYPICPILTGEPPPVTVTTNLFDVHTMAKGREQDTFADLVVEIIGGDPEDFQVVTEPGLGVPFSISPLELRQGTLTVIPTSPLEEGDSIRVRLFMHDIELDENLFANVVDYIEDTEPPVVVDSSASINPQQQLEVEIVVSDVTTTPDEALLWLSSNGGDTWESVIMDRVTPFPQAGKLQTYTATIDPIPLGSEVTYFIESHDAVDNVSFTLPASIDAPPATAASPPPDAATPYPTSEPSGTPIPFPTPGPVGEGCSSSSDMPLAAGMANFLFLLAPLGGVWSLRRLRYCR